LKKTMTAQKISKSRSTIKYGLISVAALGALAAINTAAARSAERRHPPKGKFVDVVGVRLHCSDRGEGSPVVLIHGNAVTGSDWDTSGVADLLLQDHRVIIFDRPGFGYSERPVIVGHSWGTMVALEMATNHQADTAGLVLVSGYYFWTLRPDVLMVAAGAVPVLGDILRYTILPLLGWLQMPLLKRAMFSPARVPERFQAEYSPAMALRPSQIRASSADGVLMIQGALALRGDYKNLTLPVVIIAGDRDKVVFKRRSEQLAASIQGSVLRIVKGAGHMVHHLESRRVAQAVEGVIAASRERAAPDQRPTGASAKHSMPANRRGFGRMSAGAAAAVCSCGKAMAQQATGGISGTEKSTKSTMLGMGADLHFSAKARSVRSTCI
jgi:pimeloyl-ACP methyl ester carboxylesterase